MVSQLSMCPSIHSSICHTPLAFKPRHTIAVGYYGFTVVHLTYIHLYFHLWTRRVNINGFSPNMVCALILCRSGLGLLKVRAPLFKASLA